MGVHNLVMGRAGASLPLGPAVPAEFAFLFSMREVLGVVQALGLYSDGLA